MEYCIYMQKSEESQVKPYTYLSPSIFTYGGLRTE